jgi:hypothetical protein
LYSKIARFIVRCGTRLARVTGMGNIDGSIGQQGAPDRRTPNG